MKKTIAFTGGGTGGHVYPALAVLEKFNDNEYEFFWVGSKKGIEARIIGNLGMTFYSIPSGKLRRYFSLQNIIDVFKVGFGFLSSLALFIRKRPDVLFSKGGFVTVPPVIAARLLKIPVITHESDYDPGLATKINSRFADKILVPYEDTVKNFSASLRDRVIVTGNPVRKDFFTPDREKGLKTLGADGSKPVVLVLGGSLGAKKINDLIAESLSELVKEYYVVHQMGDKNYTPSDINNYHSVPFFHEDMAHIIAAADIVISRSGAGAVWEFVTVATPSVLIPLKSGSRGDQILNAEYFKKKGTSAVLDEDSVHKEELLSCLNDILGDSQKKEAMKNCCMVFKSVNSADKISKLIEEEIK